MFKPFSSIALFSTIHLFALFAYAASGIETYRSNIANTISASEEYLEVIEKLKGHINGSLVLTDDDFVEQHSMLLDNMNVLDTDMESVIKSFELIALFEEVVGPLFISSNTTNGINRAYASDGLNLHRNIILIHQGLIDHTYNSNLFLENPEIFDGKSFKTSDYFPGPVEGPLNPDQIEKVTVKCSYLLGHGSQPWREIGNHNVVRPTGCYLAPGNLAEVIVPESLIGKGIKIRVGAHFWNLENKNRYKRLDRVGILYDVDSTVVKIAHPLGGGIYFEIPLGIDEGLQEVELKNIVRAPFYSKKTFHQTSLEEWQNKERHYPAPWADFESDKFMMQVPTSWIYNFDDPQSLMEDWDKSMDAVSDLLGRPRVTDRHKNYLQFDVIIRGGAYHPGYPMSNTPYNPYAATDGTPNHNIMRGPQYGQDIHFHELGHEVAISKFVGEVEAIVNFLYVPVLNKCFDVPLGEAFARSFGPSYNFHTNKDDITRTRLVANSFYDGVPRNTCGCTKNEVRYQHRGYAHYVDIVELYGWEALERFFQSESDAADMGNPFPVNNQEQDDRIYRMSLAAGVDLRPLFHFWGIHPHDQDALAQRMKESDLTLPMDIKQKLHQYRNLIPKDYNEFVAFGNDLYEDFLNYSGNQFDFGAGWYKVTAEIYDENRAKEIEQRLSDIITYYYGTDCFEQESFTIPEFSFSDQLCVGNLMNTLPDSADNLIAGTWFPTEIDVSQTGITEYVFTPDLSQCAINQVQEVEIFESDNDIIGNAELCPGQAANFTADSFYDTYSWSFNGEEVSIAFEVEIDQEGILSLQTVDDNGCLAESQIQLNELPEIDVNIFVDHVDCYGQYGSASFEVTNQDEHDYSYSMSGDSLLAGVYSLIVTDEFGCNSTFEFEVEQPLPLEIGDIVDGLAEITGGVLPYQDIVYDTLDNVLMVTVIDYVGCTATKEFMLTSIDGISQSLIQIYPNPSSDVINIDIDSDAIAIESINIISMNGSIVRSFLNHERQLNVSGIENGVYCLRIIKNEGLVMNKLILVIN